MKLKSVVLNPISYTVLILTLFYPGYERPNTATSLLLFTKYVTAHPPITPVSATEFMSSNLILFLDRWSKCLANIIYDFVINKPFTEVIQGVLGNFKNNFQKVSKVRSAWDTEPLVFTILFICFELLVLAQLQSALNGLAVL